MTAEQLLRKLLQNNFFVNFRGNIEWGWVEGVSIADQNGIEFEDALSAYLSNEQQQQRKNDQS